MQFNYIIEKITKAPFVECPFRHLYIENFLSDEHFDILAKSEQIDLKAHVDTESLIETLLSKDYNPVPFPGCTTAIDQYLKWFNNPVKDSKFENDLLEGFGIAFRMQQYHTPEIQELVDFLNSKAFHSAVKQKFDKAGRTRVETAIQKYLTGYEISPHPDIRKKCLTYMININTDSRAEDILLHTYFLKFKQAHSKIYRYWEDHPEIERCWVPWDWCDVEFIQTKNNSITMFAPNDHSLHAVKLDYDHCKFQRTQIYGNLWYCKGAVGRTKKSTWRDLNNL